MFQRGTFYTYTKNYNPGVIQMAKLKLKVSGDSMVASVSLLDDGVYLKVDDVLAFLQSNGISYGISMETIRELCANVKFNSEIPVAYGKGPKVGDDGKVNILVRREKVNYDTEKKVDLREVLNFLIVEANEKLAQILPPAKGENGKDVYGKEIEGLIGKEAKCTVGKNAFIQDGYIIAKVSGELVFKREANDALNIDVSEVKRIEGDIDYNIGNVRFPGSLVINGNVRPGFIVEAEQSIEIKGIVESATVIAGGEITVSGIKGAGKGIIRADTVKAAFIENAEVEAKKNIYVKQAIINSKVKAGETVVVIGKNGRIIGGNIIAGNKIEADFLGSEMTVTTNLEVGVQPELNEELTILSSQIAIDLENSRKLSLILKGMVKLQNEGRLDQEKIEQYKRSLQTAKTLKDNLESNEKRLEEIKKIIESSENDGFILAKECVYPGASITIHKRRFFPDRAMVKVMFMSIEDKIVLKGYSKD